MLLHHRGDGGLGVDDAVRKGGTASPAGSALNRPRVGLSGWTLGLDPGPSGRRGRKVGEGGSTKMLQKRWDRPSALCLGPPRKKQAASRSQGRGRCFEALGGKSWKEEKCCLFFLFRFFFFLIYFVLLFPPTHFFFPHCTAWGPSYTYVSK